MKRLILFGLLGTLLATNTGCGLFQALFCYRPCITRGDCDPAFAGGGCDEGCGPTCGHVRPPVYGPRRAYAAADCGDTCGDVGCGRPCRGTPCGSCDPCADPCGSGCYGRCWHRGPLSCLFALFTCGTWWGPNCGERYWGDFYSDSPDCWDPCDGYGNYTGSGCQSCGGSGGGYSGGYSGGSGGGCRNCNGGGGGGFDGYARSAAGGRVTDGGPVARENYVSQDDRVVNPNPKPATQPHRAARPQRTM